MIPGPTDVGKGNPLSKVTQMDIALVTFGSFSMVWHGKAHQQSFVWMSGQFLIELGICSDIYVLPTHHRINSQKHGLK